MSKDTIGKALSSEATIITLIKEKIDDNTYRRYYVDSEGNRHGKLTVARKGKIIKESNYVDGLLDGSHILYYYDGCIRKRSSYHKGKLCMRAWFTTLGKCERVCLYKQGSPSEEIKLVDGVLSERRVYDSGIIKLEIEKFDNNHESNYKKIANLWGLSG